VSAGPRRGRALGALVVDDEAPARRRLTRLLTELGDVEVVGEAGSGEEAVLRIAELEPDLVFLDIQMPGLDGFGVIQSVGMDEMPLVIFVTAFDEHAVAAFEVRALDYLLKPVAPARLAAAVERAHELLAAPQGDAARQQEEALASLVRLEGPPLTRLLVQGERGAHLLLVQGIDLARAERNYVVLHTAHGIFRVRGTIGALAERLDPAHFLRVNRSDIVRLDAIRELQPWSHGDYRIVLQDGRALLWSRRYRAQQSGTFELG
jgi:two-component system LytT family response regulator